MTCDSDPPSPPDFSGSGPVEYMPEAQAPGSKAERVLARETAHLMALPGVVSVGIGLGPMGEEVLVVGVVDAGVAAHLPREIDGLDILVSVTGEVDALRPR